MIAKNATPLEIIAHSPALLVRLAVMLVLSALSRPLRRVWRETAHGLPAMIAKRQQSG
jgi:hypothetical protein